MTRSKQLLLAFATGCLAISAVAFGGSQTSSVAGFKLASEGGAGCDENSRAPEVFELYGDPATVLGKLDKLDLGLDKRRLYVFTVESAQGAELRLFEKQPDGKAVRVSTWKGATLGDLGHEIGNGLLKNKGVHCAGEQTKSMLNSKLNLKAENDVPFPVSARSAFAHSVQNSGSDFVRATIFLLC